MRNKILSLLVLLLTAVTGAWAQGPVDGTIAWSVGNEASATVSASIKDAISSTGVTTGSGLTVESGIYFDTGMVKYTPTTANAGNVEGVMIEYTIEAVDGYKFKPTGVDYAAVKVLTDNASYSWSYTIDGVESAITDVSKDDVLRNNGSNSGTAQLMHSESITADGCSVFTLRFYISNCGTSKNICIGNITISGSVSAAAATGPEVAWDKTTKTGTFAMPAFDVVLTPIYAKAAAFATTGTEPEVKTLLPEAAEGVIAGTDASLIAEGTGIVAFAGTSTEVTQGTLMYAIGTSATEAPALTAFSATLPTAENIADEGAEVLVWYYIKGADTPTGQTATAENTFNDSEICTTPLTVTVLSNKYDIQFNAANANTIESGKATVTVGGTAATVTEGKLQGVKMGSEVKVKANTGYKFRKVEVKKGAALKTLTVTGVATKSIYYAEGDTWQQAIERPENEGSGWRVQGNYILNGGLTLMIGSGYVRPEHTIDATKNYSLQAD